MDIEKIHSLISDMFILINENKNEEIRRRFHISNEVIDEIRETISDYFGDWRELKPIDIKKHLNSRASKPMFDVFSMNQPDRYGVECVLVDADDNETELIFHAEIVATAEGYKMEYKYIGS
ncbi:hypothetical protein [Parazoarcus communis]|uniref:hypothetical protein n=1 Tax=Parazoarcus communis TaxID=41977 RepID=UPI001057ADF9|nr:hypothetical protein [Parazoarcus communis]NMG72976.1 hypothetical protein [Parazoarcus communis SWub3 = DSM 12120]